MQVALATLWSCFPVSASGADVLLFSLLHTSSGSSCSPETNHGLLRSSRSPFFLPVALTFYFKSFFLPLLIFFLSFFLFSLLRFFPSLCLTLDRSASLWSHQSSPPSAWACRVPRGREEARTSEEQPSREKEERRGTSHASTSPHSVSMSVKVI